MTTEELRARFEELAYQRYLEVAALAARDGHPVEVCTPAGIFWRAPDGTYGVHAMNSAWWGFQAGANLSPPAFGMVPVAPRAPTGDSGAIFPDIDETDRAGGIFPDISETGGIAVSVPLKEVLSR